jgi:nucleotide-binding universal stress UspA family protein
VRSGPVLIGYDGSAASERALRESAALLAPRTALVVVAWEAGVAFEMVELPTSSVGIPPVAIDIPTALELEKEFHERAERLAERGASLARELGFDAEGLVVADERGVGRTLVRVAEERDAQAIVVGAHNKGRLSEVLLGSTSQAVVRLAPCPVVVVRGRDDEG